MNAETRSEMFGRLLKKIPNPTTELNYSTSFELLVADQPKRSVARDKNSKF